MNKFVGLLIVVGLLGAAYVNRDKIAALRGGTEESAANVDASGAPTAGGGAVAPPSSPGTEPSGPIGTPHPAKEGQAEAARLYPGLLVSGSPLNKRFVALHAEAKTADPELLTQPDWPITLAERAMVSLGGAPLPRTKPATAYTPKPLPGSALDAKPKK